MATGPITPNRSFILPTPWAPRKQQAATEKAGRSWARLDHVDGQHGGLDLGGDEVRQNNLQANPGVENIRQNGNNSERSGGQGDRTKDGRQQDGRRSRSRRCLFEVHGAPDTAPVPDMFSLD